jgi:hypothetical protein
MGLRYNKLRQPQSESCREEVFKGCIGNELGRPQDAIKSMIDEVDDFIEDYHRHLGEIDRLAQQMLNAHFEIDTALNDVLISATCNSKYLEETRLSFLDKVNIARALTPESHEHPEWQVIIVLNGLRNEVAHHGQTDKRDRKLRELRATMLSPVRPKLINEIKEADDIKIVSYAAAMGTDYLLHLMDEIRVARGLPLEEE